MLDFMHNNIINNTDNSLISNYILLFEFQNNSEETAKITLQCMDPSLAVK